MNKIGKELNFDVARINLGIYFLFIGMWMIAINDSYYFATFKNSVFTLLGLIASFVIIAMIIIPGFKRLRCNKRYLKTSEKVPRVIYVALIPNILGYAFMGIATFLISLYLSRPIIQQTGINQVSFWHQYSFQAGILFFAWHRNFIHIAITVLFNSLKSS